MKRLILLAMLLLPALALADGPGTIAIAGTSSGVWVEVQDETAPAQDIAFYLVCATTAYTVSAWNYDDPANPKWLGSGFAMVGQDSTLVLEDLVLGYSGKIHALWVDTVAATGTVYLYGYRE